MADLPARPDLEQLRRQAKELLRAAREGDGAARERIAAVADRQTLAGAQLALAREYGFASWPRLKREVERREVLDSGDVERLAALLAEEPDLATTPMEHWCDHPRGASPLGYTAMLRYDTAHDAWRDVSGTGAVARTLIAAGAAVDGDAGEQETPLITAASYGDADVARALIEAGADLEARAADDSGGVPGGTALLHAAVFGMTDVVDVLVAAGAQVHGIEEAAAAGDVGGWLEGAPADACVRALVMAADHQRLDVIDRLIAAGTPVDATDPAFGGHPLRTAASNGRPASVRRLLAHGADPNLPDGQGHTPLDLCRTGDTAGHRDVEGILVAFRPAQRDGAG
jgi:ankyrin repeat protein